MELTEFGLDEVFYTYTGKWFCLDIGKRSVIAIQEDTMHMAIGKGCWSWDEQLPYAITFSLVDIDGCSKEPFEEVEC